MAVRKVAAHLCLTLIIKELKISVEQDRVVTTLNIINTLNIIFMIEMVIFCSPIESLQMDECWGGWIDTLVHM